MRSSFGDRTISAAGPQVWNRLLPNLRLCGLSYGQFRRLLKTFLFGQWGHGAVWTVLSAPNRNILLTYLYHFLLVVVVIICLFCIVPDIFMTQRQIIACPWNLLDKDHLMPLKFAPFERLHTCSMTFRSNYGPILYRLRDIKRRIMVCPWNLVNQVHMGLPTLKTAWFYGHLFPVNTSMWQTDGHAASS